MINGARRLLRQFAQKVLDIDDTTQPTAHIRYFEDYLSKHHFDTDTTDLKKFFRSQYYFFMVGIKNLGQPTCIIRFIK